jgi:hypothetical protein
VTKSQEEESKLQGLLSQLSLGEEKDKMGTFVLIGGVVVVLGVIGLIIYKRSKAS